jgi:SAM-dependent methyltransferase
MKTRSMRHAVDPYEQTIQVYRKLGTKYIRDTLRAVPQEIQGFIRMIPARGKILDVGCAGGRDAKYFVRAQLQVIGIDVVDEFLAAAKKNVPKATFINMDVRRLRFPNETFDAIWANAILLHLRKLDIRAVIKKFHALLRPTGKLHIRMKRGAGRGYTREQLVSKQRRLFTYIGQEELETLVRRSGFRIIRSRLYKDQLGRSDVQWVGIWAEKV